MTTKHTDAAQKIASDTIIARETVRAKLEDIRAALEAAQSAHAGGADLERILAPLRDISRGAASAERAITDVLDFRHLVESGF